MKLVLPKIHRYMHKSSIDVLLYYVYHYHIMQNRILQTLLKSTPKPKDHQALPSVRAIALAMKVAPLTVQRALRELVRQKRVYARPRKGYYWGAEPQSIILSKPDPLLRQSLTESLRHDWQSGLLDPFAPLPSLKSLSARYHVNPRTLRHALEQLAEQNILQRQGRGFAFTSQPKISNSNGVLVLAIRCKLSGELLMESERELEFLRRVFQETASHGLSLRIVGVWEHENHFQFMDRHGSPFLWPNRPEVLLGILVSTWLIHNGAQLLEHLSHKQVPLSVWWEHPHSYMPKRRKAFQRMAIFNLAFGEAPGQIVGEFVLGQGIRQVAYLSPFHHSEWSQTRCSGLRKTLARSVATPLIEWGDAAEFSPWSFQQKAWKQIQQKEKNISSEDHRVLTLRDKLIRLTIHQLLQTASLPSGNWALVCANDSVADVARSWFLEHAPVAMPLLVSFDNTSLSYLHQFASFAFNTEAMVREMIFHVLHPNSRLFAGQRLLHLTGQVVAK